MEHLLSKFELGETLGTGAFSEVKLATERVTGNRYAIKIIDKAKCKGKEGMIETEVNILIRVQHEHIVQLYEMFAIENKIYLVMEMVTGGELFDDIVSKGKYNETDASRIIHKILGAVDYLHSIGIAHRDLKPENLLLSDKSANAKVVISDFGLSKILNDESAMKTACGTPGYVAPEVLRKRGYGREVDLWSIGVISYILLCGYPPFYDQNNAVLFRQIMSGRFEFDSPWWDNISKEAKDFIRRLLVLDPKQRYTAKQALAHPYIVKTCGAPVPAQAAVTIFRGVAPLQTPNSLPSELTSRFNASPASSASPSSSPSSSSSTPSPAASMSASPDASDRLAVEPALPTKVVDVPSTATKSPPVQVIQVSEAKPAAKQPLEAWEEKTPVPQRTSIIVAATKSSPTTIESPFKAIAQMAPTQERPIGERKEMDDSGCVLEKKNQEVNDSLRSSVQSQSTAVDESSRPGSTTIPQQHNQVRILSYNIFLRPPGIKGSTSDFKNARLNHFAANMLPSYDIVCLQEIYSSGSTRMSKLLACAKKHGFEYHIASPSKGILNTTVDGGLLILSRYPIIDVKKLTYLKGIHGDKYTAKGAIYAKIRVSPNKCVHVFNTHLQSSAKDAPVLTNVSGVASPASTSAPTASSSLDPIAATGSSPTSILSTSGNGIGGQLQIPGTQFFIGAPAASPLFYRHNRAASADGRQQSNLAMSIEASAAAVRLAQLVALKEFMDDIMRSHPFEAAFLAGSLNVNSRPAPSKFNGQTAQNKHSDEYLTMLRLLRGELLVTGVKNGGNVTSPIRLKVNDLMYETQGEHPVTFGEVDGVCRDGDASDIDPSLCASIDYIMLLSTKEARRKSPKPEDAYNDTFEQEEYDEQSLAGNAKNLIQGGGVLIDCKGTKVEKLLVEGEPFTQLSGT
ncbi:calcium calmodulin-dependent protein kinase type 1G [Chytriomyces hyalinus]|nr:calcium calmodulin-dependent protein kinase type 1G [Chytriomyces hyalinus]